MSDSKTSRFLKLGVWVGCLLLLALRLPGVFSAAVLNQSSLGLTSNRNFDHHGPLGIPGRDEPPAVVDDRVLHQAATMTPDNGRLWSRLGLLALNNRELDKAIAFFTRAVDRDRDNPLNHLYLGYALHQHGDVEAALRAWEAAGYGPAQLLALENYVALAASYRNDEQPGTARDLLLKALELDPTNLYGLYWLSALESGSCPPPLTGFQRFSLANLSSEQLAQHTVAVIPYLLECGLWDEQQLKAALLYWNATENREAISALLSALPETHVPAGIGAATELYENGQPACVNADEGQQILQETVQVSAESPASDLLRDERSMTHWQLYSGFRYDQALIYAGSVRRGEQREPIAITFWRDIDSTRRPAKAILELTNSAVVVNSAAVYAMLICYQAQLAHGFVALSSPTLGIENQRVSYGGPDQPNLVRQAIVVVRAGISGPLTFSLEVRGVGTFLLKEVYLFPLAAVASEQAQVPAIFYLNQ